MDKIDSCDVDERQYLFKAFHHVKLQTIMSPQRAISPNF